MMTKIDKKNKKKNEAAINEEYALADKYKKDINTLKSKMLTEKDIQELLEKRPAINLKELLELMIEEDKTVHFSQNFVKQQIEGGQKLSKENVL